MAISATHYRLLREHRHLLPRGGSLLEIGEAEWYGDADPLIMRELYLHTYRGETVIDVVSWEDELLDEAIKSRSGHAIAKAAYAILFSPSICDAIDLHGTPAAWRYDLNRPVELPRRYDLTINHGTAEHIFNIAQVFKTVHDWTLPGGLMIHEGPFTGWLDHGFYCLQPTLFYDLAAVNGYELVSVSITEIASNTIQRLECREHLSRLAKAGKVPLNAMLFVVLRKVGSPPFRVPMQGVYSNGLSDEGRKAWRELR